MIEHTFTQKIRDILSTHFASDSSEVLDKSHLIQYLNIKTRSATRGSKSRSSFGNIYAIYVLIEDYLAKGFDKGGDYANYTGAVYTALFTRMRQLPFGAKLQNHAINHRMNEEFKRYFPTSEYVPIIRDVATGRYWINENLLRIRANGKEYNIASAIIDIIQSYIETKRDAFEAFIKASSAMQKAEGQQPEATKQFILSLLEPNVDARLFEVVGYAILKHYYNNQIVYLGYSPEQLAAETLKLYKTGRTNANDGGIDYVMRPLGRFFQVTETLDVRKYFLDIDKLERYPITFVIKSNEDIATLRDRLKEGAKKLYGVEAIVSKYMEAVEEVINIHILKERFEWVVQQGHLPDILAEIIKQSKVEFNYEEDEI